MDKLTSQMIFVSDIHLFESTDELGVRLLDLISRIDSKKVEYFVLGGDIFDFCFGASKYFKKKYAKIGFALEELAHSGTKVIFVQGNHEFSLESLAWKGVDFVTELERDFSLSCGTTFSVTHGDRFFMNWSYRAYIAITRSTVFKWVALLLPQKQLDRFALYCSKSSRKHGSTMELNHDRVISAAGTWLEKSGSNFGLFGHFHYPYDETLGVSRSCRTSGASRTPPARLLSVNSWYKPNMLVFDQGEISRVDF